MASSWIKRINGSECDSVHSMHMEAGVSFGDHHGYS
jgi:hypothetical protein